ncbi:hypothetical protein D9757_005525 [Collybiopsis confluens]|uniref:Alpha-1,3-glucosyltransferase n=1 Tax=Collybiopsis confluens TaxID=2823264 RepID=A0A8H5HLR9_9AGAR|nr:hypothetical protein D9757_005525 [Collybiopsis confluens]
MADFPDPSAPSPPKSSRNSLHSFPRSSSASSVTGTPLAINTNSNILRFRPKPSPSPEILAPQPRRHLLESNASQSWLHTPPLSPASSRGISPTSTRGFSPHLHSNGQQSFRSIMDHGVSKLTSVKETSSPETGAGRRWIRWSHKRGMRASLITVVFLTCVLVKMCVGLGSYSGENTPPMYGDYEAQRHWMEITLHLPTTRWYTYDLQYWGLDYPPLTAYVSWVCGAVARSINPAWVALDSSRGIETATSKVFMRLSVVAFDSLVYVPALLFFSRIWLAKRSKRTQDLAFLLLMFQPALSLIDFGHFQYNSIMLGLTVMALNCFATGRDSLGAVLFVLSLGFKQMALYYAPAVGSYLLAKCVMLGPKAGGRLFVHLGVATIATFTILFLPWLPPFSSSPFALLDPLSRIFPFARGLFEDKVANFWCASNVVVKWNKWASQGILVQGAAALTLLGFLPTVVIVGKSAWDLNTWFLRPSSSTSPAENDSDQKQQDPEPSTLPLLPLLLYSLLTSSMSFFLFSFQVHEKTILLPLMPLMLLFSGSTPDSDIFAWGALGSNVAVFSMWPLLKKDGLSLPYFVSILLWNRLTGHNPFKLIRTVLPYTSLVHLLSTCVYSAIFVLHVLEPFVKAPARYPDLFPVLNVLVSTPVFMCIWLWSIKSCIQVSWAITGPSGSGFSVGDHQIQHRDRAMSVMSDASDLPSSSSTSVARQLRDDGTRASSLGYAQMKKKRRTSTHSVSGMSSAVPAPPSSSFLSRSNGSIAVTGHS